MPRNRTINRGAFMAVSVDKVAILVLHHKSIEAIAKTWRIRLPPRQEDTEIHGCQTQENAGEKVGHASHDALVAQ